MEICEILHWLLIRLLDDFSQNIRDDFDDIIRGNDSSTIENVSLFIGDVLVLIDDFPITPRIHYLIILLIFQERLHGNLIISVCFCFYVYLLK